MSEVSLSFHCFFICAFHCYSLLGVEGFFNFGKQVVIV